MNKNTIKISKISERCTFFEDTELKENSYSVERQGQTVSSGGFQTETAFIDKLTQDHDSRHITDYEFSELISASNASTNIMKKPEVKDVKKISRIINS